MLYGGIDVGSLTAQAVVLKDNAIYSFQSIRVKPNPVDSAATVLEGALKEKGLTLKDLCFCVSTGYGREQIQKEGLSRENMSEISCHGKGAWWVLPQVRTIIDIGGQDAKVIRVDKDGELVNFVMNDKCAAGTGRFLDVMSKTLGISVEELGPLSFKAQQVIEMSNRCSIFCETEVHHYLQRGASPADLAAGINRTMAGRVMALVRRVGPEKEITMTGGVAKNQSVRKELEKAMGTRMLTYHVDSQIIGALGAALIARQLRGVKQ
ncbi:MAG: acyl-CoA dehydratase activase [Bacillota bacterium]